MSDCISRVLERGEGSSYIGEKRGELVIVVVRNIGELELAHSFFFDMYLYIPKCMNSQILQNVMKIHF